jgi:hypothetical protein
MNRRISARRAGRAVVRPIVARASERSAMSLGREAGFLDTRFTTLLGRECT